jgi:hypothetical protein
MAKRIRFTVALDERTLKSIDEEAQKWGLLRNSLVSMILAEHVRSGREIKLEPKK